MALMKTRRNGEPPSKVTVTEKREAYKPNVENTKKMAEYESSLSKNKATEDKYKSEVESYGKQMKVYSEQPKGRKDMTTLFQGGGRYLNPTELSDWNKQRSSDRGGLQSKKVFVSKGYGKESSDKGKLSSDKGGTYSGYLGASHEFFDKPTAPTKQKTPTVERPKIGVERVPLNKITGISTKKKQLAVTEENEKWQAPSRPLVGVESKFYTKKNVEKTKNPINKVVENVGRKIQYKKELKQGKAYFGGFEGENAGDISETKKGLKQQIKDVRKGAAAPMESITKRERLKGYKSELKQAKQAGKYIKSTGSEYTGVKAGDVVKYGSKVRFATPETFKGYKKSK